MPDREMMRARVMVDESYKEFAEKPRCLVCGRPFVQTSPTQNVCGGECALVELTKRDRAKMLAPEVD